MEWFEELPPSCPPLTQLIARAFITEFHMKNLLNLMTFSHKGFLHQTNKSREKGLTNVLLERCLFSLN